MTTYLTLYNIEGFASYKSPLITVFGLKKNDSMQMYTRAVWYIICIVSQRDNALVGFVDNDTLINRSIQYILNGIKHQFSPPFIFKLLDISIEPVVDHWCKNGWERVENIEEIKAYIKVCKKLGNSAMKIFTDLGDVNGSDHGCLRTGPSSPLPI